MKILNKNFNEDAKRFRFLANNIIIIDTMYYIIML